MPTRLFPTAIVLFSCAALLAFPMAGHGETAQAPAPIAVSTAVASTPTPLMAAIDAALAAGSVRLGDLNARLDAATDDATSFAIQREIEQAKRDTELAILGLQAEFARREGRVEQAAAIDASIARLRDVGSAGTPAASHAPADATADRR